MSLFCNIVKYGGGILMERHPYRLRLDEIELECESLYRGQSRLRCADGTIPRTVLNGTDGAPKFGTFSIINCAVCG